MNNPIPSSPEGIESIWRSLDRVLWLVTAKTQIAHGGLIATWVTQNSLDPQSPSVMAGIAPNHFTRELIDDAGHFALHLLRCDQLDLVDRFAAKSGRSVDKLAGLELAASSVAPVLKDCFAWMECRVTARLDAGDRIFFWADILRGDKLNSQDEPLRESHLQRLAPETLSLLRRDRERDIQLHAPLAAQWRNALPENLRPN